MSDSRTNRKLLRGAFPKTSPDAEDQMKLDARETPQFFALASRGVRNTRFKLIKRDGELYSIPYSLLPVFVLNGGITLEIRTHDIRAAIRGRNLGVIEAYLSTSEILWIKESPSGTDDGVSQVFIEDMEIQLNDE